MHSSDFCVAELAEQARLGDQAAREQLRDLLAPQMRWAARRALNGGDGGSLVRFVRDRIDRLTPPDGASSRPALVRQVAARALELLLPGGHPAGAASVVTADETVC